MKLLIHSKQGTEYLHVGRGESGGSHISHATNVKKKAYKKIWTNVFEFFLSANASLHF
jgi:hypothetical protein